MGRPSIAPEKLLRALLQHRVWTPVQALRHVEHVSDHRQRASAITILAEWLPAEFIDEAISLARAGTGAGRAVHVRTGWAKLNRSMSRRGRPSASVVDQVASCLRARVTSGEIRRDELGRLERMLASDLGVSRGTVLAAIRLLESPAEPDQAAPDLSHLPAILLTAPDPQLAPDSQNLRRLLFGQIVRIAPAVPPKMVIDAIRNLPVGLKIGDIAQALGVKTNVLRPIIQKLRADKQLRTTGTTRQTRYFLVAPVLEVANA